VNPWAVGERATNLTAAREPVCLCCLDGLHDFGSGMGFEVGDRAVGIAFFATKRWEIRRGRGRLIVLISVATWLDQFRTHLEKINPSIRDMKTSVWGK
jgi:hypothetical protein